MTQPQSDEEIRPVIEALRRLDPALDIRWEPKAIMVERGRFDALGACRQLAKYDGRWQIIRWDLSTSVQHRDYVVVCTVYEIRPGNPPVMIHQGAYAPIGWYLVEYMQLWDRAQSACAGAMDKLWAEHEAVEAGDVTNARAENQEHAERYYRKHGGMYWSGGAQGKASPEAAQALFGKGKRSSHHGEAAPCP